MYTILINGTYKKNTRFYNANKFLKHDGCVLQTIKKRLPFKIISFCVNNLRIVNLRSGNFPNPHGIAPIQYLNRGFMAQQLNQLSNVTFPDFYRIRS